MRKSLAAPMLALALLAAPAFAEQLSLDRIFASPSLRFVGFQVGKHHWASDHLCVVADLQKRKP